MPFLGEDREERRGGCATFDAGSSHSEGCSSAIRQEPSLGKATLRAIARRAVLCFVFVQQKKRDFLKDERDLEE